MDAVTADQPGPEQDAREELAEFHAGYTAPWLAWAVYQRDPALVAELLEPLDVQSLRALAVVLASQIPRPRTRPDDGVVDEIAVRRAADGDVGPLTRAERAAAVRLMHRRGASWTEIETTLRVSGATISRLVGLKTERKAG
ncbi:hypothetical protein [Thermomonospora cellulosilytica]|uniref:Uncharacterized protein n=1 Tax=Thermomonospora cellulosilytica TaxID=1411118 RepID=A0A7W3MXH9_9ACTN|nr:hypothetical protein [Thermomonospora cellulosilytica]MBA9003686.1 hypothetical protein [Thermomonospora cellulosilytica]